MKNSIKKITLTVLTAALMAPLSLLAQSGEGKEKEKDKVREKKEMETIVITRQNLKDEKIVVEITNDKVLVNGKEVKDGDDDIRVHRSKVKDGYAYSYGNNSFNFNGNGNSNFNMLAMDENRAMLGVTTNKTEAGAEIEEITKESGAEKAGLKKGDIILKIDDSKIDSPDDLSATVRKHKPGDKVTVTFLRDKKEQKVTTELTKWKGVSVFGVPGQFNLNMDNFEIPRVNVTPNMRSYNGYIRSGAPRLGLSIQDAEDGKGVTVLDVDEDGMAGKAGIKEEDVITEVDGKAVNSADEIAKIVRDSKDKGSVKMKLVRKGKTENVEVKIPRKLKTADL